MTSIMRSSQTSSRPKSSKHQDLASLTVCQSPCWLETYQHEEVTDDARKSYAPYAPKVIHGVYKPLKDWQIRILSIEPGIGDAPIVTRLEPAHVSTYENCAIISSCGDEVPYDALSYSRSHGELSWIYCNDAEFTVLQSLEIAMRSLRHAEETRYIWIDAICINQLDMEEKAIQVARTFTIFHRARSVRVWLGSDIECGHHAFKYLEGATALTGHRPECLRGLQAVHKDFMRLARRPWFQRTWVRQEVYAAEQVHITVGDRSLTLEKLVIQVERALMWALSFNNVTKGAGSTVNLDGLCYMLRRLSLFKRCSPQDAAALAFNRELHSTRLLEPQLCLDSQLRGSIDFDASDHRDFVYSIVSMTAISIQSNRENSPSTRNSAASTSAKSESKVWPSVFVDYEPTWSLVDVLVNATTAIINQHQCLDSMLVAHETHGHSLERQPAVVVPSWVPDWRNLPHIVGLDSAQDIMQSVSRTSRGDVTVLTIPDEYDRTNQPLLGSPDASVISKLRNHLYHPAEADVFFDDGKYKLRSAGFVLGSIRERASSTSIRKTFFSSGTHESREHEIVSAHLRKQTKYKQMFFKASTERPIPVRSPRRNLMVQGPEHSHHDYVSDFRKTLRSSETCLCPMTTKDRDIVVYLMGCSMPAIIRKVSHGKRNPDDNEFRLIGLLLSGQYLLTESYRRYWTIQPPPAFMSDQVGAYKNKTAPAEDLEKRFFVFV